MLSIWEFVDNPWTRARVSGFLFTRALVFWKFAGQRRPVNFKSSALKIERASQLPRIITKPTSE